MILYNPNPFLESQIELVEERLKAKRRMGPNRTEDDGKYTCCDVGCGSGRDVVWLAKRGRWMTMVVCDDLHVFLNGPTHSLCDKFNRVLARSCSGSPS